MSASRDIGTSGLEAATFEFWLPTSFDGVGIGFLEISDHENDGLAADIFNRHARIAFFSLRGIMGACVYVCV